MGGFGGTYAQGAAYAMPDTPEPTPPTKGMRASGSQPLVGRIATPRQLETATPGTVELDPESIDVRSLLLLHARPTSSNRSAHPELVAVEHADSIHNLFREAIQLSGQREYSRTSSSRASSREAWCDTGGGGGGGDALRPAGEPVISPDDVRAAPAALVIADEAPLTNGLKGSPSPRTLTRSSSSPPLRTSVRPPANSARSSFGSRGGAPDLALAAKGIAPRTAAQAREAATAVLATTQDHFPMGPEDEDGEIDPLHPLVNGVPSPRRLRASQQREEPPKPPTAARGYAAPTSSTVTSALLGGQAMESMREREKEATPAEGAGVNTPTTPACASLLTRPSTTGRVSWRRARELVDESSLPPRAANPPIESKLLEPLGCLLAPLVEKIEKAERKATNSHRDAAAVAAAATRGDQSHALLALSLVLSELRLAQSCSDTKRPTSAPLRGAESLRAVVAQASAAASAARRVKTVVGSLRAANNAPEKEIAVVELCQLSAQPHTQRAPVLSAIVEEGALGPLVELIASNSSLKTKEHVVGVLRRVADQAKVYRTAIANAGGIGPLVRLISQNGSHTSLIKGRQEATLTLANLARSQCAALLSSSVCRVRWVGSVSFHAAGACLRGMGGW